MVRENPINCPKCGKKATTEENIRYLVIPDEGIKCPHCGEVVIKGKQITW